MLEPLITKNESYNFAKKMVETIKQSKDAMAPNDKTTNRVSLWVCEVVSLGADLTVL